MVDQTETTTTTKKKTTGSRKSGATKGAGKSAAAKAPTKANGKANGAATTNRGGRSAAGSKAGAAKSTQRGGARKGQQQQAAPQMQGDTTMSQNGGGQPSAPMFGGTKQVLIEEVAMTNRGGRKQGPEPYPFGDLTPSRIGEGGAIIGPSFFVPDSENPKRIIATGRKRHKSDGKVFLTRKMEGPSIADPKVQVSGTRVWLAPAGYNQ